MNRSAIIKNTHGIFWLKSKQIHVLFIDGKQIALSNSVDILRLRAKELGYSFQ